MEQNTLDQLAQEVQVLSDILKENPEFMQLLNHPQIDKEEKINIAETAWKGRVSDDLTGLVILAIEKDRQKELPAVFEYFLDRVREEKGIGTAEVTSAVPLGRTQKEQIEKRLAETTSYHTFRMKYFVDESLIGGLVIRIGDRVVDSSIRTQLDRMARELAQVQLQD